MGNIVDSIKEQQEKNDAKTIEKLQTIHKLMVDKIVATSSKMQNEAIEDKSLPIVAVVDKTEKYMVKVNSAPNDKISQAIGDVMSGDFLGGLQALLKVALDEFLGNTSAGESEKVDFHVVYANNSLLRIDYMMYKYQFSSSGLKNEFQNAFCYYLQVGILDLDKVNSQILLYELTRAIGEKNLPSAATHLESLAEFAKQLYSAIQQLQKAALGAGTPEGAGVTPPKPPKEKEGESGLDEFGAGNDGSKCKQPLFPVLEDIAKEAGDHEEYRMKEEIGVVVMEKDKTNVEIP